MVFRLAILAAISLALIAPSGALASKAEMWGLADQVALEMDPYYSEAGSLYMPPADQVHISSSMLAIHARAALSGHQGPARNDQRVRMLSKRMINWPIYISDYNQGSGNHKHGPGFTIGIDKPGEQHVSFDMQISNALTLAFKTGLLSQETEGQIKERIPQVARQDVLSYPTVQLNQVNWPIQVWANAGQLGDDPTEVNRQVRGQMKQWVDGMFSPMPGLEIPNLSRGMGLHYPVETPDSKGNLISTTEYANIIYAGFDVYERMIEAGMEPLSSEDEAKMQAWAGRLIRGDWTHGGWPNWDSAHGFERWHLSRYWPWATEGLATIASSRRLAGEQDQQYAAWLLERVFERYRWLKERGPIEGTRYGLPTNFGKETDGLITGVRLAAIAARAASSETAEPKQPPGYWWYDPEMKRFTVSSANYSAAVMAPIPRPRYGGLELARLLDSQGRVLTTLGGNRAQTGITIQGGESSQAENGRQRGNYRGFRVRGDKRLGSVSVSGTTRRGQIEVSHRFTNKAIKSSYRVYKGPAVLKIPLWGRMAKKNLSPAGRQIKLQTENSEGARMLIRVSASRPLKAKLRKIKARPESPATRTQLLITLGSAGSLKVETSPQS